jgi:hypothetical protein
MSLGSAAAPHRAPHFAPHLAPHFALHFGAHRVDVGEHFERHLGEQPAAQADVTASAEVIAIAEIRDKLFIGDSLLACAFGCAFWRTFFYIFCAAFLASFGSTEFTPRGFAF